MQMSADGAAPPAPPHTTTHDQATPPTPSIEATGDAPHTTTNTAQPDTAPGGQQVDVAESPPASPPAASPPPSTGGQQQQQPGLQGASGGPAPAAIATTAAAGGDEDDDEEGFGMFGDWGGVVAANIAAEEASDADSDEVCSGCMFHVVSYVCLFSFRGALMWCADSHEVRLLLYVYIQCRYMLAVVGRSCAVAYYLLGGG